jgi:dephospho-CoA kinase
MIKVGITASMGSGKTFIVKCFSDLGISTFIMDEVVKMIYATNLDFKNKLSTVFPQFIKDDKIDKKTIASYIFNHPEDLKILSGIINPFLNSELQSFYYKNRRKKFVIVETALLFEYKLENTFDKIILVVPSFDAKVVAMKRDSITEEEYNKRMSSQIDIKEKIKKSHYIINNDFTSNVKKDVYLVYKDLRKRKY